MIFISVFQCRKYIIYSFTDILIDDLMKTIPPHLAVPANELRILDIPLGQGYCLFKFKKLAS